MKKKYSVLLFIASISTIIGFFGIYTLFSRQRALAESTEVNIRQEFQKIDPYTNFQPTSGYSSTRLSQVIYSVTYRSEADVESALDYYATQLAMNGWKFVERQRLGTWGEDFGGVCVVYTKEDLSAQIFYSGSANVGWDYEVNMRWGEHLCPPEPPLP